MTQHKKKNKIRRRLPIIKRRIKRLNRKKVWLWFKTNLKQHPFILGLISLVWINLILSRDIFTKGNIARQVLFHFYIFLAWLVLVTISNLLRDKEKVKWYWRKRFVFFMLMVLPPLGLILLWSGAQFKKVTKIIFTFVFGSFFILINLHYDKEYKQLLKMPTFDRIAELITKPKKKIFLKVTNRDILSNLRLAKTLQKPMAKLAVSEIAARCSPAVVSIKTKDKDGREIGMGSGFIISKDGFIVTNFHVMESVYQAEVKIGENIFKDVYLVKGIPNLDIALLKIDSENLPFLNIGDSDKVINGQFVIVLGNPAGLERSVSNGIISAIRSKGDIKVIQMTAPVSPGSSGGPVINEYGEVIGITTLASFIMAQNLNFAIPINYLNKIIVEKDSSIHKPAVIKKK
jgi:hypothetical protein